MRRGKDYLKSLDDGRSVYLYGDKIDDIATHPAFTGISRTVGALYDFSSDPANDMTYTASETGTLANKAFMIPRSSADLTSRRDAIQKWSYLTRGFLGRSPDHVAGFFAGFASAPSYFNRNGHPFGDNVTAFYRQVLNESLYVSYVIVPPQVSRATTAHGWDGELIQVGVLEERDDGIVVRGAQMLGTAAAISDYIFVSCIKPLTPEDEPHAISLVVPTNARGLRLHCRRPYASEQPSPFDYPLSTRFDESDALAIFDDVFVPWENVFVLRDTEAAYGQFFETAAHALGNSQAQIRLVQKLRFLIGLARKVAAVNQIDRIPSVREKLGDLASLAAIVEGMLVASEAETVVDEYGVSRPNPRYLYGIIGLQSELYPRVIHLVRELVGGGVLQLPSSKEDLLSAETRGDFEKYVQSPGVSTEERVQLFKLVWDAIGSEFAGRHYQYEMFYAGAPFIAKGWSFQHYGYDEVLREVDEFLSGYTLHDGDVSSAAAERALEA